MNNILNDLGGLYHDFSLFGVNNKQLEGIFPINQAAKFPYILAYMSHAIAKCRKRIKDEVTFTELFCADAFYSILATKLKCNQCYAIDVNIDTGRSVAQRFSMNNIEFIKERITPQSNFVSTDVVLNAGGLYHVPDPTGVLEMSYKTANKFLIVQSAVSMANDNENYLEIGGPGWKHGSRFNRRSFDKMIKNLGYNVIDNHFNELEGNQSLPDRGSVYYLIKKH